MKELLRKVFFQEKVLKVFFIAVIPAVLFYCISILILRHNGYYFMQLIRDPAQQSQTSSFIGFLSNIGTWLWVSTAAICFFSFSTSGHERMHRELVLLSGILSLMLAVDDFFMLHDRYINQKICYAVYIIFAFTLLVRHYKLIIEIEPLAFLLAGSLLALSILGDLTQYINPLRYQYVQLLEDGFKFTGAAVWLYFNVKVASYKDNSSA